MNEKYRENYEQLSPEVAALVAKRCGIQMSERGLFYTLDEQGLEQADVLLALAPDPTVEGVVAIETVLGKPIIREKPKATHILQSRGGPKRTIKRKITDNRIITKVAPNPKKPSSASFERFKLYEEGITVGEYLKRGGRMPDIKWDAERGFIELNGEG